MSPNHHIEMFASYEETNFFALQTKVFYNSKSKVTYQIILQSC